MSSAALDMRADGTDRRGVGNWDGGRGEERVRMDESTQGASVWSGRRWKRRLFWLRDMKSPNE